MLQHDIKTAVRSILRDKTSAAINLFGLTIALAGVLFILFFVKNELSTDGFHPHVKRLYRVTQHVTRDGQTNHLATTPPPMAPALEKEFAEVEKSVRLRYTDESRISCGNRSFYEPGLWYADSAFFQLFEFPLLLGDPATALTQPNSVVLTTELAQKYFGEENPIGKTLLLGSETPLEVTGVLKEAPQQSHLTFNLLVSFSTFKVPAGYPVDMNSWGWGGFLSYVLLKEGVKAADFEAKLPAFVASKYEPEMAKTRQLSLQTMHDCYFGSAGMYGANRNRSGNLSYVKGLGLVSVLILLVAAFNFTNLTLARSVRRSKEVGVRKVLGASSSGLVRLFLLEAALLSGLALFGSMILLFLSKQTLSAWLGWNLQVKATDLAFLLPTFLLLTLMTAFAAGWLPAYFFSKGKAVQILKGEMKTGSVGNKVRRWLVGAQFFMMTALMSGTIIVKQQMDFLKNRDLGFDHEQVVALQLLDDNFLKHYPRLRQRLLQNPHVVSVSAGEALEGNNGSQPISQPGANISEAKQMDILGAYFDYFKTIGVEVVQGREFLETYPTDTTMGVILNETAVRTLNWKQPIGQKIRIGDLKPDALVVGVVKDFHYLSLHDPIKPLAIFIPNTVMTHALVRLRPGDFQEALASIRADWEATLPEFPFDLRFLDERMQQQYLADQHFSRMVYLFTGLTLLIAGLGLYGLVAILLSFRVREIGIRKVLGATTSGIVAVLTYEFLALVVVSILVASPVAWYFMERWLQNFAYRIDIQWVIFLVAGAVAVLTTSLTVGFQSMKAAVVNPVDSLKNE